MGKNYGQFADDIMKNLGGQNNVKEMFHCATRLRVQLNDIGETDLEALKKLAGVLGVIESVGGVQVIIGNDVSKVFAEITSKYQIAAKQEVFDKEDNKSDGEAAKQSEKKANLGSRLLNNLSAIVGPAIPLIICSGLVSAILVILTKLGLSSGSDTYTILNMVGNAALYFLPVMLAYTSAKRFGCDIMTSLFLGAILVSPTLISFIEGGSFVKLFILPVKTVDYTSTLIPIVLTIWVFSYIEKFVAKIIPDAVKFVFKPFLCIVIMIPVMLCVTGPVGSYCGDALCALMTGINNIAPWASVLVIGCLAPLLVLTGMHLALIPLVMMMFQTAGYDNMLFVAFIGMNFSQFGVSLACIFKSKSKALRTLASSCALTSFLAGVTEPSLYGICIRMKKPLIATWIACVVNAVFCAVTGVKVFSFGAPSFFTMPIFMNPNGSMTNFYFAIAAAALTIAVSFAATWIIGFDDSCYGD